MTEQKVRLMAATERALAAHAAGETNIAKLSRQHKIQRSTIYRALRRQREASSRQQQREVK